MLKSRMESAPGKDPSRPGLSHTDRSLASAVWTLMFPCCPVSSLQAAVRADGSPSAFSTSQGPGCLPGCTFRLGDSCAPQISLDGAKTLAFSVQNHLPVPTALHAPSPSPTWSQGVRSYLQPPHNAGLSFPLAQVSGKLHEWDF